MSPSFSSFYIAHKTKHPTVSGLFVTLSAFTCTPRDARCACARALLTPLHTWCPLYCFTCVLCRLFKFCHSSLQISSFFIFFPTPVMLSFQILSSVFFNLYFFSTPIFLRAILAASQLLFPFHFFFVALARIIVYDVALNSLRRIASLTRFPLRLSRTSSDVFSKQSGIVEGCGRFR